MKTSVPMELTNQVSLHEAGHYIVGRVLGFNVAEISINIISPESFAGGCVIELYQKLQTLAEVKRYLRSRIQVLYAGVLSQSFDGHQVNEEKANAFLKATNDCSDDFSKIRELLRVLVNIDYSGGRSDSEIQNGLDEIKEDLWQRTIRIVEDEREYIKGLGGYLASKVKAFNKPVKITIDELNKMEPLIKRFGVQH